MQEDKKLAIRELRREQTDAEQRLWFCLRSRKLAGFKFNRQYLIGPYIVDFCCLKERLVIEIDGFQHVENREYDKNRTLYLEARKYRVIRFWNDEIMKDREKVVQAILDVLIRSPQNNTLSQT